MKLIRFAAGALALVIALIGVGVITAGADHILECQRESEDQGRCALKEEGFTQTQERSFPLQDLEGARLDEYIFGHGSVGYRVEFIVDGQVIPLGVLTHGDRGPRAQMVNQVNDFVDDTTITELHVAEHERGFNAIVGGGFIGFGLLVLSLIVFLPAIAGAMSTRTPSRSTPDLDTEPDRAPPEPSDPWDEDDSNTW